MQYSFRFRHLFFWSRAQTKAMPLKCGRLKTAAQLQAFANHVWLAQPFHQGTKVSGQPDSLQRSRQHYFDNDTESET